MTYLDRIFSDSPRTQQVPSNSPTVSEEALDRIVPRPQGSSDDALSPITARYRPQAVNDLTRPPENDQNLLNIHAAIRSVNFNKCFDSKPVKE